MPAATERDLTERLQALRAKDPHYFAKRYRTADQIARLAYHSSLIEGRRVSLTRLIEAAGALIEARSG